MNILKRVLYTGVGVVAVAAERVGTSMNAKEAEEKHEVLAEIIQELKAKKSECLKFLSQKANMTLGYAPNQSEVEKLKAKIKELETRLENMKNEEREAEEVIKK